MRPFTSINNAIWLNNTIYKNYKTYLSYQVSGGKIKPFNIFQIALFFHYV